MTTNSLPSTHPGTPVKAQYKHCPSCHDHATTLQRTKGLIGDNSHLYCPNCKWTELPFPIEDLRIVEDLKRIKEDIMFQAPNHPPQIEVVPDGLSTPGINYQLIPPIVWERGAKRFMLGQERKGDKAWNADSPNQHILTNKKFILDRLAHTMAHTIKLMDKIRNDKDLTDDDDAAAIWWGAAFAICATDALTKEKNDSSPF